MKLLLLSSILFLAGICVQAQTSVNAGPHVSAGSTTKEDGVGVGINVEAATNVFQNGALRLISGYTQFPKDYGGRVRFVPVRFGYQHLLLKRIVLLADIGTGTFFYPGYTYTRLSYGAGIGYRIPFATNYVQLSAFYEHTNDNAGGYFGWVNYRLAYGFNFNKRR